MIIVKYVIVVLLRTKDVIMLVYRPHYPMIVGFLSGRSCINIISDSDGMDRKQIFRFCHHLAHLLNAAHAGQYHCNLIKAGDNADSI